MENPFTSMSTMSSTPVSSEIHHEPVSSLGLRQRAMPDIAKEARVRVTGTLDKVGMSEIEVPVRIRDPQTGELVLTPARAEAFVSLDDADAKGIHMSRLFLTLQRSLETAEVTPALIGEMLREFLRTHADISERAYLALRFDLLTKRPALVSDNAGWRSYPVVLAGSMHGEQVDVTMATTITYSSTCPCSAALARQLIQERFDHDFAGADRVDAEAFRAWLGKAESICATPHSQRSHADVEVVLADPAEAPSVIELVNLVESALQTPVQAAVKRADEQAFALLNGQNLMFCEDAGRRIKHALNAEPRFSDFRVRASHFESLHPHDAVSVVTKGVEGGLQAS